MWWVKTTGQAAVARLEAARTQLWAEAVALFQAGALWYPVEPD